ncbi:LacI family DNA-binding transcriptional regulator [Candidatus Bipolaricaulota bacterium]|nr:LacI family DNA-binding transcriptional regulator [Candidatus Bipolaricaulota bacterium]
MRVTIHDIARIVGVAPSTVSRALSGKGRISPTTRERIRKVAEELGYQPNMLARGLATRSTCAIGVVIHERHLPLDERSFYGVILETIEAEVSKHGYHVVFSTLRNQSLPRCIKERRVDGVIFLGTDINEELIRPINEELPVVLVDHCLSGLTSIVSDNVGGAYLATEHLFSHGHREIAFVAETLEDPSFRARFEGYRQALEWYGLRVKKELVVEGGRRSDSDQIAMKKLLRKRKLPTAIFAANDFMAAGAIKALTKAGLSVPDDVAVVGFDDGALATLVHPPLTSVRVPRVEMGKTAASCIIKLLASPSETSQVIVLSTPLTIRESCGCKGT